MLFQNPPLIKSKIINNKEILSQDGELTGHVSCCYKFGIDASNGDLFYKDLSGNWQPVPNSGGGGGGDSLRFGVSGEDDTAGETRIFDLDGNTFEISGGNFGFGGTPTVAFNVLGGLGNDLIAIDTDNYQSLFRASDNNSFSSFVLNSDLANNNVQFALTTTDNVNLVQIIGDAIAQIINLGADGGVSINSAYVLPPYDGTDGQVLVTDGGGTVTWQDGGLSTASVIEWSVIDILNTPSGTTNTGDKFLVGTSPTGAFVGHADEIATSTNPGYTYETATIGDLLYRLATDTVYKLTATGWILVGRLTLHQGGDRKSVV